VSCCIQGSCLSTSVHAAMTRTHTHAFIASCCGTPMALQLPVIPHSHTCLPFLLSYTLHTHHNCILPGWMRRCACTLRPWWAVCCECSGRQMMPGSLAVWSLMMPALGGTRCAAIQLLEVQSVANAYQAVSCSSYLMLSDCHSKMGMLRGVQIRPIASPSGLLMPRLPCHVCYVSAARSSTRMGRRRTCGLALSMCAS
jgi:hypothetical protein